MNNKTVELTNDKYEETFSHVDKWSVSEAGTNLRAVTRLDIRSLSVSCQCIASEVKDLREFNQASSLIASIWDEATQAALSWVCCMTDLKTSLTVETPTTRYYKVSFKLKDLEN